ncbi:hypothetical protein G4B88_014324 [Cannabis sativa]|uniref:Uncharacterized protein n=1 Tax=Cannabis sativa TaxID=3483 RepID=A0A7J6I9Y7_CANSA|nr:hypothetical protein G4B88_014324 [Cannabis sativa]
MAIKVHPLIASSSNLIIDNPLTISSSSSSKRETLTVWMKSLVMQGNGCTAYNQNGQVVYRIDNYDHKNSNEVFLMDLKGKVLFTILRKKMWAKRKQSSTGVILGDDVLNLVIEASVDHSLVMALVTVYGLMQRKM